MVSRRSRPIGQACVLVVISSLLVSSGCSGGGGSQSPLATTPNQIVPIGSPANPTPSPIQSAAPQGSSTPTNKPSGNPTSTPGGGTSTPGGATSAPGGTSSSTPVPAGTPGTSLTAYATLVKNDKPLVYYRLNDSSGSRAIDSSGNGHTGTYVGSPGFSHPALVVGDTGAQSTSFVSSYLTESITWPQQAITTECWIKPVAADAVGAIHGKRLSSIELFQGENWTERTRSEREAGLVQAERLLSAEQGRNPVKVHFEVMDEGQYGYYDGEIHVRSSDVDASTPDEALNTIAHEGRHAYQDYCIDNPDTHTNQEQVTRWAENALPGHYKVPGDVSNGNIVTQAEYEEQPLEADAWSYGNAVARTVASQQTR